MSESVEAYLNEMMQLEDPRSRREKAKEITLQAKQDIEQAEKIAETLDFPDYRCSDCGQEKLFEQTNGNYYCPLCEG